MCFLCMYVRLYVCIYVRLDVCMDVFIMYVCMYIDTQSYYGYILIITISEGEVEKIKSGRGDS